MGATKERAAVIMGSARKQIQAKNRVMQETSFSMDLPSYRLLTAQHKFPAFCEPQTKRETSL
jgi:hypothetical protein